MNLDSSVNKIKPKAAQSCVHTRSIGALGLKFKTNKNGNSSANGRCVKR